MRTLSCGRAGAAVRLTALRSRREPVYVKGQIGHTDATLTLNYYAREMDRRDDEPERLNALVEGRELVATVAPSRFPIRWRGT